MSQYNYLTGRKELFDGAPPEAMVVLETNDGQIYYAVSHNRGAKYWYEHGNPGRPIGLIALFEKTRVVASRALVGGLPKEEPKRDPIPKSRQTRLDRMEKAQNGIRKAVSQPVPVKPKPEPKPEPEPVKVDPPKKPEQRAVSLAQFSPCVKCGATGIHACPGAPVEWKPEDKQRLNEAVKQIVADEQKPKVEQSGFVSIFDLSVQRGTKEARFVSLNRSGNICFSTGLYEHGDQVDVQIDPTRGLIRVGKVETGGRTLSKSRQVNSLAASRLFAIPEGKLSIRIYLTEENGWWHGQAELAGVKS